VIKGNVTVQYRIETQDSMNSFLGQLQEPDGPNRFRTQAGLPETSSVVLRGFSYSPAAASSGKGGGEVHVVVDFTLSSSDTSNGRRLTETQILASAVEESVKELIPLSPEAVVDCSVTFSDSTATANVVITVKSDIAATQKSVASFLSADSQPGGTQKLPQLISTKSGISLNYSPGYIPIIWSTDGSPLVQAINILPYVLAAVGVLAVVAFFVICRYRLVIKSFLRDVWNGRWSMRNSGGWTGGRYAAQFINREKSDISSTPDTATNVDDEEFDIDLLQRRSISLQNIHNSQSSRQLV
jgi:hypothetical protein